MALDQAAYILQTRQFQRPGDLVDPDLTGEPLCRAHSVYFAPGSRTAGHTRPLGQVLHVTGETGRVQRQGGEVIEVRAGDTVHLEPGETDWGGAAPMEFLSHLAIQEAAEDGSTAEWFARVTDEEYGA